jgi:hypothetical protein
MLNQEDAMDLVPDRRGTAAWARKAGALDWSLASASPAVALRRVGRVAAALGTWISARWHAGVSAWTSRNSTTTS